MTDNSHTDLGSVVQFQSIELSRLVRDNKRLNERIDHLLDDIRALRELQHREQKLREREQSLREKDHALRQDAHESMREMIEMAFILPKKAPAKTVADGDSKSRTEAATELAAIHRDERPKPALAAVQQPLFSERYRNVGKGGASQAAWPEIPAFLRRTT